MTKKIANKSIKINNEASFQLQLSYILKSVGELYEFKLKDNFIIDLETYITLRKESIKSNSNRARVDILLKLGDKNEQKTCAIELKYFKKNNHREPNNRYDVFKDLSNLEQYKKNGIDLCYFMLGTDHEHYVTQSSYSNKTNDFDFRDDSIYKSGSKLNYETGNPYGPPLKLSQDYEFKWKKFENIYFLKVEV